MIVSMPQIAVSTPPVKAPVNPAATPEQFATALSQASGDAPNPSSNPRVMSKAGSDEHGNLDPKNHGKSNTKAAPSSANSTAGPPTAATPSNDNPLKPLNSPPLQTSLSALLNPAAAEINDDDSKLSTDSAEKSDVTTPLVTSAVPGSTIAPSAAKLLKATDQSSPTSSSPQADGPKLTSPNASKYGMQQAVSPVSSEENSKAKAASEDAKLKQGAQISAGQNFKSVSANSSSAIPAESKPNTVDSKPVLREGASGGGSGDAKTSSTEHHGTVAMPPLPIAPLSASPSLSAKPAPTGNAQSPNGTVAKVSSDAVSASSGASKKDGNATQNPYSQSGKSEASSGLGGASMKPASTDSQTQWSGNSGSSLSAASQVSQPVTDAKTPSPTVSSRADTAANAAARMSSAAHETESSVETAAAQFASPIQIAKLVERAGQSELRVGIQAGEFGSVDIRTSMAHSQFTAEISVERGELGRAMSVELPALHERLAEQRVPPAHIIVQDHSYSSSGSSDLRQGTRQNQYATPNQNLSSGERDLTPAIIAAEAIETGAGLDIHI